jgi:hypothetical protein
MPRGSTWFHEREVGHHPHLLYLTSWAPQPVQEAALAPQPSLEGEPCLNLTQPPQPAQEGEFLNPPAQEGEFPNPPSPPLQEGQKQGGLHPQPPSKLTWSNTDRTLTPQQWMAEAERILGPNSLAQTSHAGKVRKRKCSTPGCGYIVRCTKEMFGRYQILSRYTLTHFHPMCNNPPRPQHWKML